MLFLVFSDYYQKLVHGGFCMETIEELSLVRFVILIVIFAEF